MSLQAYGEDSQRHPNEVAVLIMGEKIVTNAEKSESNLFKYESDDDRFFFTSNLLFTMNFYPLNRKSTASTILKLLDVCAKKLGGWDLKALRKQFIAFLSLLTRSCSFENFFAKTVISVIAQPPYSPDIVPTDIFTPKTLNCTEREAIQNGKFAEHTKFDSGKCIPTLFFEVEGELQQWRKVLWRG